MLSALVPAIAESFLKQPAAGDATVAVVETAQSQEPPVEGDCRVGGPVEPEGYKRFANTSIWISSPAQTIWDILVDMPTWADWNDVFKVTFHKGPAVNSTNPSEWFEVHSYFETAWPLMRRTVVWMQLTRFDAVNHKICWNPQGFLGLHGIHCFVLCPSGDGTQVYNYEDQKGPLSGMVRRTMGGPTTDGFNKFNEALRVKCEGGR